MIDSGAQGDYINPRIVNRLKLPWNQKKEPYSLITFEGSETSYNDGKVTQETAQLPVTVAGRTGLVQFDLTRIGNHDAVLGTTWLRQWNPRIDWATDQLSWEDTPRQGAIADIRKDLANGASKQQSVRQSTTESQQRKRARGKLQELAEKAEPDSTAGYYVSRYPELFQEELDTGLPKHSRWDHEIKFKPGFEPRYQKLYPLGEEKSRVQKEYIEKNLARGYIRDSDSPAASPMLFAPKKDDPNGRPCVDYRHINEGTIKDRYPLPLITELQDRLRKAKHFTAADLKGAYNLIRIKEGDEWKTAFNSRYGHYEYLVMPFGLTNAPATFQRMINDVLREYLDTFVIAYLDDILIFSETLEDHKQHVDKVFRLLRDANLLLEFRKCYFHVQKVDFLGFTIEPGKVMMQKSKLAAIKDWPIPTKVKEVQSFTGTTNFYRKLIKGYGEIARPLTKLTRKDQPWEWGPEQQRAFDTLKERMLEEPILRNPDPTRPFEVETDASDFAMGAQLGQRDDNGVLHPVAFISQQFKGAQLNYTVGDKELLAIVEACRQWRPYLSGARYPVKVFTDHKNLMTFTTTKELNKRQVRWSEELAEFDLQIQYVKGTENRRADALSRRADHEMDMPAEARQILRDTGEYLTVVGRELAAAYRGISEWETRLQDSQDKAGRHTYEGRLFVPADLRTELLERIHGAPTHGHQGVAKTYDRLRRNYDWPGAKKEVQDFIGKCTICSKSKSSRHKPYGTIRQPSIPEEPWQSVTMDFIVKLPLSKDPVTGVKYDSILNINDRLTKAAEFIPYKESSNAEQLAHVILRELVARHGLPREIITDRGSVFTSKFWQSLVAALGVKSKLSTAYHPQTDGQTERTNQTLEQYLRSYINQQQDNWVTMLPMAQFAYNSSKSESTGFTPFYANHGREPEAHLEPLAGPDAPKATTTAQQIKEIWDQAKTNLTKARKRQAQHYNKSKVEGPTFEEGDLVFLNRKNIKTKRPNGKLDFKKLGPFRVNKVISDVNYQLELPDNSRIHPVFHVSLLEPAPAGAQPETDQEIDEEPEYEVEKILQQRTGQQGLEYLVKWKSYPPSENSWEPAIHLENCQTLLRQFRNRK
jgi:hypothetical protein